MPPKFDPNAPEVKELTDLFEKVGLSNKSATDLVRQPKSAAPFKTLVDEFSLASSTLDEKTAGTLVKLSGGMSKLGPAEKGYAVERIVKGDIKTPDQVSGELCQTGHQVVPDVDELLTASRYQILREEFSWNSSRREGLQRSLRSWCVDKIDRLNLADAAGIEIGLADLPDLVKGYVEGLSSAPESWSSLGPLLGGIKNSASNLKYVEYYAIPTFLRNNHRTF